MAAGTSYSKRYAGGFVDKPLTSSPIDSQFLNAVEAAMLQIFGLAPTVDGQVAQWDFANTRFGPALILNKNVDPAAAIASTKIDFTGANGIVDANVSATAAIAQSKIAGLTSALSGLGIPIGMPVPWPSKVLPTNYGLMDGSSILRASFPTLFTTLVQNTGIFTVTLASPGVFTLNGHGFVQGDAIYFTTTGALPTGLSANTTYYVISTNLATNTFSVSASAPTWGSSGAITDGSAVATSVSQSGAHTAFFAPYGVVDATHFNMPDWRGRSVFGIGTNVSTKSLSLNDAVAVANRRQFHQHTKHSHFYGVSIGTGSANQVLANANVGGNVNSSTSDGGSQTSTDATDASAFAFATWIMRQQ